MFIWLVVIYAILFAFLTWRRFDIALAVFFFALPSYLIRFSIGPLPTTLLEMTLWIIIAAWIIGFRSHITYHISRIIQENKLLSVGITLFLLCATISIFTSTNLRGALGEWKTFYIEPVLMFIILIHLISNSPNSPNKISNFPATPAGKQFPISKHDPTASIIIALALSGLITSALAIYQHFTGWMVPYSFWENQNTYRVTAWYGFPNAVGLFLAPILPLGTYLLTQSWSILKNKKYMINDKTHHLSYIIYHLLTCVVALLFFLTSSLAIIYAKSTGAIVGLAAGLLFFLFFYNKKTRLVACLVSLVGLVGIVSLSPGNPIRQELLLRDRSGQIRLGIWSETYEFLKDNPVWGAGLASYQEKIRPYHKQVNGENIEIFHHPHNVFLTMYVNTGILGLIGFILIIIWFFKTSLSHIMNHGTWNNLIPAVVPRQARDTAGQAVQQFNPSSRDHWSHCGAGNLTIYLTTSMVVILVMGLVDSPYIKNDLSIFFWLLPAMLIVANGKNKIPT